MRCTACVISIWRITHLFTFTMHQGLFSIPKDFNTKGITSFCERFD